MYSSCRKKRENDIRELKLQISSLESELTTLSTNLATTTETSTSRRDEGLQKVKSYIVVISTQLIFVPNVWKVFMCDISAEN